MSYCHSTNPVIRALHERGISGEVLAQLLGCTSSEWNGAVWPLASPDPRVHRAIAALTDRQLCELWPKTYAPDGSVLPTAKRPGWRRSVPEFASHAEVARRLAALGLAELMRLAPVAGVAGRNSRPRSLPPQIPLARSAA